MATVLSVSRDYQCPICAGLLTDPKTLACSHTFCKSCLTELLSAQGQPKSLVCPFCDCKTDVPDGDVSNLSTDESLKSVALDVEENGLPCDVCDDTETRAEFYCCECDKHMCSACRKTHDGWKPNREHTVLNVDDILKAEVFPKKKVLCQEHDKGDMVHECTEVCITCKMYICIKCSTTKHENQGHTVKSAAEYDASYQAEILDLRKEAKSKSEDVKRYQTVLEEEKTKSLRHIDMVIEKIERIYEESMKRLDEQEEILNKKCDDEKEDLDRKFNNMKLADDHLLANINTAENLVDKCSKAPLDEDTVIIRDSMCIELKTVLSKENPTNNAATEVYCHAEQFQYEGSRKEGDTEFGEVQYSAWKQKADIALSTVNTMNGMVATPDGRMAVECGRGEHGIEIYSADGQLQQTVLMGKHVRAMGFLSDGRCVVRDTSNNNTVSTYTPGWEKLDVKFETLSKDEGGHGDLTVDSDDHIYVSYRDAKKIHVFTPAGGKPVREIQCDGYEPYQIFAMKCRDMLVVNDFIDAATVIDSESGCKHHTVIKGSVMYVYPALREDDTILIATVNNDRDRLNIEHYTSELKHVSTLITDHVIEKTKRNWHYIQEFSSGEIAFCTPDRLYIFYKQVNDLEI